MATINKDVAVKQFSTVNIDIFAQYILLCIQRKYGVSEYLDYEYDRINCKVRRNLAGGKCLRSQYLRMAVS